MTGGMALRLHAELRYVFSSHAMKKGLLIACAALAACTPRSDAIATPIDGYAAIVNDRVITVGEVFELIQPAEEQLRLTYSGAELEERVRQVYTNALASLIDRALIVEEFDAQGGSLPDRYVNDRLDAFIQDRFKGDRAAFIDALTEQQVTLEEWREDLKERLIVNLLRRQEVQDKIRISPTLVRERYEAEKHKYQTEEKARIRMIMLNRGATENERAVKLQEANSLVERLKGGADFAAVARESSEGSKSGDGGDFGWVNSADLRPEFKEAIADLKPGEISEPVEAGDELYIIKLEEFQPAGTIPFEEVRKSIEDQLRDEEADRLYKAWTNRLRRKFYVQVF
jgi:parvulin-like peptidyl-prolyl isomerase